MNGRKRLKTEAGQSALGGQLQAVEALIGHLSSVLIDGSSDQGAEQPAPDDAQLDALMADLLRLQSQLGGSPAQHILDEAVQEVLGKLQGAAESLQAVVDKYTPPDGYRPPVAGDEQYVRDILVYAHKLSYTTFAPSGFVPGQTALRHFKPPAPQDLQLRSSLLHQFQRDCEARQLAAKQAAQAAVPGQAAAAQPEEPAPAAPAAAAPAEPAPKTLDDIYKDLPPMPPGWKPGDPIPGLGELPAAAAAPAPKAPQPEAAPASEESEEEEEEELAAPAGQRPLLSSAFALALNPDMLEFGAGSSESEEESDEESD